MSGVSTPEQLADEVKRLAQRLYWSTGDGDKRAGRHFPTCLEELHAAIDALAALSHPAVPPVDLHAAIMNLPCDESKANEEWSDRRIAYKSGHRDARHAAAELVSAHPAVPLRLEACKLDPALCTMPVSPADHQSFDEVVARAAHGFGVGTELPPDQWACDAAASVPKGWRLVPEEPTEEMLAAAHEGDRAYTLRNFGDVMTVQQGPYDHWVAMLAAAPSPAPAPHATQEATGQDDQAMAVFRFLSGEAALDGVWFGENHPTRPGKFWWRTDLRHAVASLKADAERYRWLRGQHWSKAPLCVVRNPKHAVKLGYQCPSLELLDAAIDAAMSSTPGAQS